MASNFLCPFEPGTSKPLGIQKFKLDGSGKTIQDKLSPDPIDGHNKSKEKSTKQKMLKPIVKNQKKYNLGSNNYMSDVSEAAEFLLKRDYPRIAEITESHAGHSGQIFVPQSWLSKVPTVVSTMDFEKKQEQYVESLPVPVDVEKGWIEDGRKLQGERPEKELYEELSEYFRKRELEEVVVLHGSELLVLDLEKRKENDKWEKDFISKVQTRQT